MDSLDNAPKPILPLGVHLMDLSNSIDDSFKPKFKFGVIGVLRDSNGILIDGFASKSQVSFPLICEALAVLGSLFPYMFVVE